MKRLPMKERYFILKTIEGQIKKDERKIKELEEKEQENGKLYEWDREELDERKISFKHFTIVFDMLLDDDEPEYTFTANGLIANCKGAE